jgi:hypothetical protein
MRAWLKDALHVTNLWVMAIPFGMVGAWGVIVHFIR